MWAASSLRGGVSEGSLFRQSLHLHYFHTVATLLFKFFQSYLGPIFIYFTYQCYYYTALHAIKAHLLVNINPCRGRLFQLPGHQRSLKFTSCGYARSHNRRRSHNLRQTNDVFFCKPCKKILPSEKHYKVHKETTQHKNNAAFFTEDLHILRQLEILLRARLSSSPEKPSWYS